MHLLRWLRRQLREPLPVREHLEAAVLAEDVAEVRRLVAAFGFSDDQRYHVESLLDSWRKRFAREANEACGARQPRRAR